jgi:4-diphosphocytidyl-2-C-methyl-D-erythritol kinase
VSGPQSVFTEGALTGETAWPAPAKLNLFLHITGRRADGYHELQTVFQFVDHGDSLFFGLRSDGAVRRPDGPAGVAEDNDLTVRAARALQAATGCPQGVDIRIDKRIPMGAGLGGGSSDAATTLVALNRLWNTGLDQDHLAAIGLGLGADVPVFVRGTAAWGEGIGEQLTPIELPEPWFLVLTPAVHVDSGEIFRAAELPRSTPRISREMFLAGSTRNDCERVTCARHPLIAETLQRLGAHGPARMSGTGSSVFCPFATREEALRARRHFAAVPGFVARGLNQSPLLATGIAIIAPQHAE